MAAMRDRANAMKQAQTGKQDTEGVRIHTHLSETTV